MPFTKQTLLEIMFKKLKTGVAGLALAFGMSMTAGAGPAFDFGTLTNGLTAISNNVVQGVAVGTSQAYQLTPGYDLAVFPKSTGGSNSTVIFGFDLYSGTSWSTTAPLQATNTSNAGATGTNVVGYVVFTRAQLAGASFIRWDYTSTTNAPPVVIGGVDYQSFH